MARIDPPVSSTYGFVTGKIIRRTGNAFKGLSKFPEAVAAEGFVVFTPETKASKIELDRLTYEFRDPIVAYLNSSGVISPSTSPELGGVWLLTGRYKVTFHLLTGSISPFDIDVLETATPANPLDLVSEYPYG